MQIKKTIFYGLLPVFIWILNGYCIEEDKTIIDKLLSKNAKDRKIVSNIIIENRKNVIEKLISILTIKDIDKSFKGSLHRAIDLLGKLRSKEAVKPLSQHILFVPEGFKTKEMIPTYAYYVAAVALINIGYPSIEPMLLKIKNSESKEERDIAAWVVMKIEGKDQAVARFTSLINKGKSGKDKWEAALKFIKFYKPTFYNPLKSKK